MLADRYLHLPVQDEDSKETFAGLAQSELRQGVSSASSYLERIPLLAAAV
eukprot:CAMPEP_0185760294 /NCGR_PEP_ID=MMETSP1174-20130828/19158_1 /TAXON_ID=35687 /ORGANISM="Dictyocha speculum, Strain CCMP1381" /LENGTH=49 /DNA_ID= /DNA_START= /DNA_END= /DNA_ORIENTATION=